MTQTGAGPLELDGAVARVGDVGLLRVRVGAACVGVTILDPAYVGFALPVSSTGEYVINGEVADLSRIYMSASLGSVHVRGGGRDTLGVVIPRDQLMRAVAALRGVDPEDVKLKDRFLRPAPAVATGLRRRLADLLDEASADRVTRSPRDLANETISLMADACLQDCTDAPSDLGHNISSAWIVRKAEEAFLAAGSSPVSLADLCAAVGVGKSALYLAFHGIVGESPISYFRKRRLIRARSYLMNSNPERGAVKRAALSVGQTEFGRFSVEYRRLFGESPSDTLRCSAG